MSQYKVSANLTNGSQNVVIPGVDATAFVGNGDWMVRTGDGVTYTVASSSYSNPNTTVVLTGNYAGATGTGVQVGFQRDFTVSGLPLMNAGDIETAAIFSRAMNLIESDIIGGSSDVDGGSF